MASKTNRQAIDSQQLRAQSYLSLFETEIPDFKIKEIRCAMNSTTVLGSDVFKRQIEQQTGLTLIPNPWGGCRSSQENFERGVQIHLTLADPHEN